ncbi:MAG: exodeoxyribonuclease V subunit gamma [Sphingobacteriales bacterium]|nr:MAG: exodeoxyribonuclease V subunit gamma [Sphingobacteriales bacterium]TAF82412.1 MAG: exodeoxyribonuclease V subunit gamma [Sphingobacteriales bacterium]
MAINLQVSNSLTQLAKGLCTNLQQQNQSVFTPHILVTQTEGMNNWLKQQMVQNLGIAANYKFLKPNDLIQQVYHLCASWGDSKALSAENQTWLLYTLLAEAEFIQRFKTVANYYQIKGPDKEIKRLALAQKIADLFDQYQIYRPQLIRDWNANKETTDTPYDWQKYLWLKTKKLLNKQLLDKTLLADVIIEALKNPQNQRKLKQNMPAVHLFGLSIITGYHLELFNIIGQYIPVWFHIINPAPVVYWFEDKSEKQLAMLKHKSFKNDILNQGNALLTNWGSIIKDTFGLLFKNEDLLNAYEPIGVEEPKADTLLHCIQQDIFNNALAGDKNTINIKQVLDGSISINSCFTPVREVEVLYSYLVHLVNNHDNVSLSARDIVVMVSDIDAYAPYIKAVFNNAPYKFPFTIADESLATENTLSGALKSILTLNADNLTAENVLQLLDNSYIKNRFGIADVNPIRNIVAQANIRFGITGNLANESIYVSWHYGLQRIIYGLCMRGEEEYFGTNPSIFPLDAVEGLAANPIINFCHFVQVLISSITQRDKNRDLANWILYIHNVLHHLVFEPIEETDEDYDILIHQLAKYNELNGILTEQISYDVFTYNFVKNLCTSTRSSAFATGGITFCSLIPMRSIPFKIVALLGLNFDSFPRKEKPISFNLMDKKQAGDRNVKENDKHLFLETLLSAQQYLYISYLGQSVKDNSAIPPSVLVDELINYIQDACISTQNISKQLVTKHPLHSFSQKYNYLTPRIGNYIHDLKPPCTVSLTANKSSQTFDFSTIDLDKMISFFQNPIKGYYKNVLDIRYSDKNALLPETELFELDDLQKWSFKNNLLRMNEAEILDAQNQWVKKGKLPLKNMAELNLQLILNEVSPVKNLLFNVVANADEQTKLIEVTIGQTTIKTELKGIYGEKLVEICWSKNENKYLLSAYIKYLVARAAGLNLGLYFISAVQNTVFNEIKLSQQEAEIRLCQLIELYKQGHEEILVFYPSLEILPSKVNGLLETTFLSAVDKIFNNDKFACDDQYLINEYQAVFFDTPNALEKYKKCAELLLKPLDSFLDGYVFKSKK